jgi:chaperone modulatory protein CbpM
LIVNVHELVLAGRLDPRAVGIWVDAGWLKPRHEDDDHYSEIDIARARLIRDLQDLGVNDDSIPIVLDLIDQVHGLRHVLGELLLAMNAWRSDEEHP